jgi:hypothetical protein
MLVAKAPTIRAVLLVGHDMGMTCWHGVQALLRQQ